MYPSSTVFQLLGCFFRQSGDKRDKTGANWTAAASPPEALYVLPTGWRLYYFRMEFHACEAAKAHSVRFAVTARVGQLLRRTALPHPRRAPASRGTRRDIHSPVHGRPSTAG